jgi:hypothetical protein
LRFEVWLHRVKVIVKFQFGFSVFADEEGGLFCDAIDLTKGLAEKEIGEGAFNAAMLMLESQGFLASPFWEGGESSLQFLRTNRIEVFLYKQSITHLALNTKH